MYDPSTDEIAPFEHQVGAHGGLGGMQTKAFVLYPAAFARSEKPVALVGAEEVNRKIREWIARAQELYATGGAPRRRAEPQGDAALGPAERSPRRPATRRRYGVVGYAATPPGLRSDGLMAHLSNPRREVPAPRCSPARVAPWPPSWRSPCSCRARSPWPRSHRRPHRGYPVAGQPRGRDRHQRDLAQRGRRAPSRPLPEGPEEFDSGNLEPGESFTFTFSLEGSYPYRDERDDDDGAYAGTIVVRGRGRRCSRRVGRRQLVTSGTVSLIDRSFVPPTLEIATGGTVTWSNDDGDDLHTVTSEGGAFDSGILEGGATFSQTFTEAGTYPYACAVHPEMHGTIVASDPAVTVMPSASAIPSASAVRCLRGPLRLRRLLGLGFAGPRPPGRRHRGLDGRRAFAPADIEVRRVAVDWLNDDSIGHTVTALDGSFNSGVMGVGDAFSVTFETPGTFDYLCAIHPTMRGTVTVSE